MSVEAKEEAPKIYIENCKKVGELRIWYEYYLILYWFVHDTIAHLGYIREIIDVNNLSIFLQYFPTKSIYRPLEIVGLTIVLYGIHI
jgi:hypothetical protein